MDAVIPVSELTRRSAEIREQIEASLRNSGLSDDSFGVALRSIASIAEVISEAAASVSSKQESMLSREAQDKFVRIAAHNVRVSTRLAISDAVRATKLAYVAGAIALALAIGAILLGWGYMWGQRTAQQSGINIQETWAFASQLASVNDATALRAYCLSHIKTQSQGYAMCSLPDVWITRPQEAAGKH